MEINEQIRKAFETFTLYTGIKVTLFTSARDIPRVARPTASVIENGYGSWYDRRTDAIYILNPGAARQPEEKLIQRSVGDVLDQILAAKGLDGLLRESTRHLFNEKLLSFTESEVGRPFSFLLTEPDGQRREWLLDGALHDSPIAAELFSRFLCGVFRLSPPPNVAVRVRNGIGRHHRAEMREREKGGDAQEIGMDLLMYLEGVSRQKNTVVLGAVSEPFVTVGFPNEAKLAVNVPQLRSFIMNHGLGAGTVGKDIVSILSEPMAILENNKPGKDGGAYAYVIVSGREVNGGRLCFIVISPKAITRTMLSDPNKNLLFAAPAIMSDTALGVKMAEEGKLKYLQARQTSYGVEYPLLDEMEKKIGAVASPGMTSGSNARLLKTIANIRINFRNPKNSEEFFQFFQRNRDALAEERVRRGDIARQLREADEAGKPAPAAPTTAEKLSMLLPTGAFSESVKGKLLRQGIRTYGDAMRMGMAGLKALIGPRATRLVEKAFQEKGLSLITSAAALSEDEFLKLNDAAKAKVILRDFGAAISGIDPELTNKTVKLPCSLSGKYFGGEAALHLVVRMCNKDARWNGCPVFATAKELDEFSLKPLKDAEPVHLKVNGRPVTLYNVIDTDFLLKHSMTFGNYMKEVHGNRVEDLSLRMKILLGNCSQMPANYRENYYSKLSGTLAEDTKGNGEITAKAPSVMEAFLNTDELALRKPSEVERMAVAEKELQGATADASALPLLVQNINGRLYTGPAQQMLRADAARRGLLPFYLTKEQAAAAGLTVKGSGTEYYASRPKGMEVAISKCHAYNVEDTDFPERYPEHYNIIKSFYKGEYLSDSESSRAASAEATAREVGKLFESPKNRLADSLVAQETMRRLVVSKGMLGKALTFQELVDMAEGIINTTAGQEMETANETNKERD